MSVQFLMDKLEYEEVNTVILPNLPANLVGVYRFVEIDLTVAISLSAGTLTIYQYAYQNFTQLATITGVDSIGKNWRNSGTILVIPAKQLTFNNAGFLAWDFLNPSVIYAIYSSWTMTTVESVFFYGDFVYITGSNLDIWPIYRFQISAIAWTRWGSSTTGLQLYVRDIYVWNENNFVFTIEGTDGINTQTGVIRCTSWPAATLVFLQYIAQAGVLVNNRARFVHCHAPIPYTELIRSYLDSATQERSIFTSIGAALSYLRKTISLTVAGESIQVISSGGTIAIYATYAPPATNPRVYADIPNIHEGTHYHSPSLLLYSGISLFANLLSVCPHENGFLLLYDTGCIEVSYPISNRKTHVWYDYRGFGGGELYLRRNPEDYVRLHAVVVSVNYVLAFVGYGQFALEYKQEQWNNRLELFCAVSRMRENKRSSKTYTSNLRTAPALEEYFQGVTEDTFLCLDEVRGGGVANRLPVLTWTIANLNQLAKIGQDGEVLDYLVRHATHPPFAYSENLCIYPNGYVVSQNNRESIGDSPNLIEEFEEQSFRRTGLERIIMYPPLASRLPNLAATPTSSTSLDQFASRSKITWTPFATDSTFLAPALQGLILYDGTFRHKKINFNVLGFRYLAPLIRYSYISAANWYYVKGWEIWADGAIICVVTRPFETPTREPYQNPWRFFRDIDPEM